MMIIVLISLLFSCMITAQPAVIMDQARIERQKNNVDGAVALYKQALELDPHCVDAYIQLYTCMRTQEKFEDAIAYGNKALVYKPGNAQIYFDLAYCHLAIGHCQKAIDYFQEVFNRTGSLQVLYNVGYAHKTAGNIDEGIACYEKIIAQDPGYDAAQFALGHAYLIKGDFQRGWKQHERYLKQAGKNGDMLRMYLETHTIADKTILLRPEGGLGDTFQFVRYGALLHDMGARTILACQPELVQLLAASPYLDSVIAVGSPTPKHDAWVTLMSLPALFYSDEATIPRTIPYIHPDENLVQTWHDTLGHTKELKVGLCWQASVQNDKSRLPIARRGIPLATLLPLTHVPGTLFYSLQQCEGLEQIDQQSLEHIIFFSGDFDQAHGRFMDSAAVIANLDLVITIDSAIAHLAGALGKRVWLLLPYATDWRWIAERTDSPWYPTMRIFKQPQPFDWNSVVEHVSHALALLVEENITINS